MYMYTLQYVVFGVILCFLWICRKGIHTLLITMVLFCSLWRKDTNYRIISVESLLEKEYKLPHLIVALPPFVRYGKIQKIKLLLHAIKYKVRQIPNGHIFPLCIVFFVL